MPRAKHLVQVEPTTLRCYRCWQVNPTVEHIGLMWPDKPLKTVYHDNGIIERLCATEYVNLCSNCQMEAIATGAVIDISIPEREWKELVAP